MKCPECNATIRKGSKFCSNCGTKIQYIEFDEDDEEFDEDDEEFDEDDKDDLVNSAKQGDDSAQLHLGLKFYLGEGVEKDYDLSFAYLSSAAKYGNEDAKEALEKLFPDNQEEYEQEYYQKEEQKSEEHSIIGDAFVHIGGHILKHIIES